MYGAGFTLPLLILALFADVARGPVRRLSSWLPRVEKVSGALMAGLGLYLMLGVASPPGGLHDPDLRRATCGIAES